MIGVGFFRFLSATGLGRRRPGTVTVLYLVTTYTGVGPPGGGGGCVMGNGSFRWQ